MRMTRGYGLLLLAVVLTTSGCGDSKKAPELVPAEVVVTLNGQPLPNALITVVPQDADYGSNAIASGVTDEAGRTKLAVGSQNGACVGNNLVTIAEGPPPEEVRSQDGDAQNLEAQYVRSLKNRPIPPKYATAVTSDQKLTITPGQTEYKLELKR